MRPDDRVPGDVIARAKAAYGRRPEDPLAMIVSDARDRHAPGRERRLRFVHPLVCVELCVMTAGEHRCVLRGCAEPPQLRVELELEGSPLTVVEDATAGSFVVEAVPRGVMRLGLVPHDGARVTTEWFLG
jgi:hypothetical protein